MTLDEIRGLKPGAILRRKFNGKLVSVLFVGKQTVFVRDIGGSEFTVPPEWLLKP